ncbi:MAG: helix-turn-helix transcriptional regulator [Alphaproteobacteria bacterium]|nr:helix-turn-helix transcriptional regulator [Alphaproteobacteria bacterium]
MDLERAASRLAELGHVTRLEIFQTLVRMGREGMSIGEVQEQLDLPASTLAFHLKALVAVGLVNQVKEGRTVRCRAELQPLVELADFLKTECCSGLPAKRRQAA